MTITSDAIKMIKSNAFSKAKLGYVLGKSVNTIERYLTMNIDNGPLTTIAAMEVLKKETGLSEEEILNGLVVEAKL